MKRFWLVLLSLGLIAAFSTSALALDVKFSGSYYLGGMYLSKISVNKTASPDGQSTAFYFQRLRVQTEFVVSPGLSAVTSFDALERVFGGARTAAGVAADNLSAGTRAENQNIAFDNAYLSYSTSIGLFRAGMMWGGPWAWSFGNTTTVKNRLLYWTPNWSGFSVIAIVDKAAEGGFSNVAAPDGIDRDMDVYGIGPMYNAKNFQVHYLLAYVNAGSTRVLAPAYKIKYYLNDLGASFTVGPVRIEGEVIYIMGKAREYEDGVTPNVDYASLGAYLGATAKFGPAYVGGFVAYTQGQDSDTTDKVQNAVGGGNDWNPCLIMFNYDLTYWQGGLASLTSGMTNAWMYQINGGVNIDKLSIGASLTYATKDQLTAAEKLASYDKPLGIEFDVTGTYKITNNLSYMLGIGYLATGDYFKGANKAGEVHADYLILNRLTLTF